jgi:hypothetical protein
MTRMERQRPSKRPNGTTISRCTSRHCDTELTDHHPNDARSVALTALRPGELHPVLPVGHSEVLRLLAKRNVDIGDRRTQVVCRLHSLLVALAPGRNRQANQRFRRHGRPRSSRPATTSPSSYSATSAVSTNN